MNDRVNARSELTRCDVGRDGMNGWTKLRIGVGIDVGSRVGEAAAFVWSCLNVFFCNGRAACF